MTRRFVKFTLLLSLLLFPAGAQTFADSPNLAFKPAGKGLFEFDTGVLKGRLKMDGKSQGIHPLIDVATGEQLVSVTGVFSPYRVFTTNRRYGNAARDWPTQSKLLADGAVEVHWTSQEYPFELTAVYRWQTPDTLDLEITVRPSQPMPDFELFMSSYFTEGFRASVYQREKDEGEPRFVPVDKAVDSPCRYVMFPKDEAAKQMILDGRWGLGKNPVDWYLQQGLAAPVAMRHDERLGLTALMMCPVDDCFAISSPWNPESADARGYRSLYLSLFGQDLKAGQTAVARCRLIVRRNLSADEAVRCYQEYVKEPAR